MRGRGRGRGRGVGCRRGRRVDGPLSHDREGGLACNLVANLWVVSVPSRISEAWVARVSLVPLEEPRLAIWGCRATSLLLPPQAQTWEPRDSSKTVTRILECGSVENNTYTLNPTGRGLPELEGLEEEAPGEVLAPPPPLLFCRKPSRL